jgi:hypothetical protein
MGWRDINMNRRKPPMRLAVVPVEAGEDLHEAVLRKACRAARASLDAQRPEISPAFRRFAAGYLAGFARHQGLKHGVDAEQADGEPLHDLLQALEHLAPSTLADEWANLRFVPRDGARTRLRATDGTADAGYLLGHLESLCGTERLLRMASGLAGSGIDAFLTACDTAADRLQTHQPTMSLRFDPSERAVMRKAFSPSP